MTKGVDAEARQVFVLVGDVEVACLLKAVALVRSDFRDLVQHRLEVVIRQRLDAGHGPERAVATEDRRLADLQMDVARAELDGAPEGRVQVHERSDPASARSSRAFRRRGRALRPA
jgi:hypothetical protein